MCKLKSMIVLKDRIYCPDHDHHQQMLEELGIEDNYLGASKTFVRVELSPANDDITIPVDKWLLRIDQDITPEWFDVGVYGDRIYETVKAWAAEHIHTSGVVEEISAGIHFVAGSATIKTVAGSATIEWVAGSATIEWVADSATIETVADSATIERVTGSATIEWVADSATIERVTGSATIKTVAGSAAIKTVAGSATIEWVAGSATIERVTGSATIKTVAGSATIERVTGSATIKTVADSATIETVAGSATIEAVADSATIEWVADSATIVSSHTRAWSNVKSVTMADNATLVDRYNKTIYQAGDGWTFVKAEEEVPPAND